MSTLTKPVEEKKIVPTAHANLGLFESLRECASPTEFYRQALRAFATHYDSPYAAIQFDLPSGSIDDHITASDSALETWKKPCDGMLLSVRYQNVAKAKLYRMSSFDSTFAVLATPLADASQATIGSLAIATQCSTKEVAEARLAELLALVNAVRSMNRGGGRPASEKKPANDGSQATGIAKAGKYENLHEFAFAITNNLKSKIGCDQICLGLVRHNKVRIFSISGLDSLYPRSPGAHMVRQAMEECCDAGEWLCYQSHANWSEDQPNTGHRLHKRWHEQCGNVPVATIPMMVDGKCIAILALRFPADRPCKSKDIEKIASVVTPLAPGLLLLERAQRTLGTHLYDALRVQTQKFVSKGSVGRKVFAVAIVALVAWMAFGKCEHRISVPCEIKPAFIRHVVAPFEGAIAESFVEPSDEVKRGQLLIQMDTRDLIVERGQLLAELEIAKLDSARATADKHVLDAARANAQASIARSRLAVLNQRIAKADIRAGLDGTVVSGEVLSRVGEVVPLGEPLLELAPNSKWTIDLHVPEFFASHLQLGQSAEFTTNARPDEFGTCRLARIEATSDVRDGKNVFTANAMVVGQSPPWLRSGMQGVARIDAGRRPVWWVWFHRVVDSVRLQLWKL